MFPLQPILENELIRMEPLQEKDFERLYAVASDPLVWEQHPNKNRYKREVFETFFNGAMDSGGAFLVLDKASGDVVGSSRFYDLNQENSEVLIGYTFIGRKFWGGKYNPAMKKLMLDHAFKHLDNVVFHIGAKNIRSQKAIEKLGATKIAEIDVAYIGETETLNFIYRIRKEDWK